MEGARVSDKALLEAAAAAGFDVTPRQLERWHKAGLLPRKTQDWPQGVRGSVGGSYPSTAMAQFLELCRLRSQRRKLAEIGFWLWWDGHDVEPRAARKCLTKLAVTVQGPKSSQVFDVAELGAAQALEGRGFRAGGRIKRRLKSDEDALTVLVTLLVTGLGGSPLWATGAEAELGERSPQELVFTGLGLDRAGSDKVDEAGPWLAGGAEDFAAALTADLKHIVMPSEQLERLVAQSSTDALDLARDDARMLTEQLPVIVAAMQIDGGPDAFGLGELRAFAVDDARSRATIVAMCLALRQAGLGEQLDVMRSAAPPGVASAERRLALHKGLPENRSHLRREDVRCETLPAEAQSCLQAFPTDLADRPGDSDTD